MVTAGSVPWIARVPEALLNDDPRRERPSDFCAGCVEQRRALRKAAVARKIAIIAWHILVTDSRERERPYWLLERPIGCSRSH